MNIYVSVTSIYDNQHLLVQTLRSIAKQTYRPTKCYIFLSTEPYLLDKGFTNKKILDELHIFLSIHDSLFVVKWVKNTGPYRKLLPLLKEKWNEDCLILTIDDDIVYHPSMIASYIDDYNKYKCCIAYRGYTPVIKDDMFKDITYAERGPPEMRHIYNFANSGVGTVTHPSFFHNTGDLVFNDTLINKLCKTTDDIWYYFCRIANRIDTVVINKPQLFQFNDVRRDRGLFFTFNCDSKETNKIHNGKSMCKNSVNMIKTAKAFRDAGHIDT